MLVVSSHSVRGERSEAREASAASSDRHRTTGGSTRPFFAPGQNDGTSRRPAPAALLPDPDCGSPGARHTCYLGWARAAAALRIGPN